MKLVSRIATMAIVAVLYCASPAHALTVVLGHINQSSYEATASIIQTMLERMGYNVAKKRGGYSVMYPLLAERELDLFVGGSLPNEHAEDWAEYKDELVLITPLYEEAKLFWAVPSYVPRTEVRSVADLAKPEVAAKMEKVIRGPEADTELMQRSKNLLQHYGLADAGYELTAGKSSEQLTELSKEIEAKKWVVVPLWQPHYFNKVKKLRILKDPDSLLGKPDTVWLVGHKDVERKMRSLGFGVLKKMELSIRAVNELEYEVNVEGRLPSDAARRWIGLHPYTVEYWLETDADD